MRALVVTSPGSWVIDDVPDPEVRDDEVLLEIAACGLCGTDLHTISGDNPTVRLPITSGHEFVGRVSALGKDVTSLNVGDRVAVDPCRSCGVCRFCRSGHANICGSKGGYGSKYPGGFAERVAVRATSCVRIPDQVPWAQAVLSEPLACVLNGVGKVPEVIGRSVLVMGGGPIGILAAVVLRKMGGAVTLTEPRTERRRLASEMDLHALAPDEVSGDPVWDVIVDATGVPGQMSSGLALLGRGGVFLILGVAEPTALVTFSPSRVNWWEQQIIGSTSINGTFAPAVSLLEEVGPTIAPIVRDVIDLEDFDRAYNLMRHGAAVGKIILAPNSGGSLPGLESGIHVS